MDADAGNDERPEQGTPPRGSDARTRLARRLRSLRALARVANSADRSRTLFLQNMSHEVRTPLAAVIGYADLLLDPSLAPAERAEHVQAIRRAAGRLESLVGGVLDLAAIEAGGVVLAPRPTRVSAVVDVVLSRLRPMAAGKGLGLRAEYLSPVPEVVAVDHERLVQVVGRLVENAIRHTEGGGVHVGVRYVAGVSGRGELVFEVADTGPGIPAGVRPLLFRAFEAGGGADGTGADARGGLGLGLAIARGLARQMGGDVELSESRTGEDHGSVFAARVRVEVGAGARMIDPAADADGEPGRGAGRTVEAPVLLRGRVLVAEDSVDNQRLICHHLKSLGLKFEVVEDGRAAVDRVLSAAFRKEPFDVVLMDMQMPVLDGYAATSLLRQSGYAGTVLALTAHAGVGETERCLCAGCDEHLTKPIDRFTLARTLGRYMARDAMQAPGAECEAV